MDCSALIFAVKHPRLSELQHSRRWRHYDPSKHGELLSQWISITCQKNWFYSKTAVRTLNLAIWKFVALSIKVRHLILFWASLGRASYRSIYSFTVAKAWDLKVRYSPHHYLDLIVVSTFGGQHNFVLRHYRSLNFVWTATRLQNLFMLFIPAFSYSPYFKLIEFFFFFFSFFFSFFPSFVFFSSSSSSSFFFFFWRYNPLWVSAFSVIFFHSVLSLQNFLHTT